MKYAAIQNIAYILPKQIQDNASLARDFPDWSVGKIFDKTGIAQRHIADQDQLSSDLGILAAEKLIQESGADRQVFDYLIFCTQSPDYFLPASACLIQHRLGIGKHCGAVDINQGCSGYIYGLGLAKGLIESGQASNVLLVTGETYSKFIRADDRSVRTLFGDAASATWLCARQADEPFLHSFVYGSDGGGADHLIVRDGGMRANAVVSNQNQNTAPPTLYMNGPEVLNFTLREVPGLTRKILERAGLEADAVDSYVFHQANRFMLESLRKKMNIPAERFVHCYESCGNTVSATIPIALVENNLFAGLAGRKKTLLAGFGVGFSWAGCMLDAH